MLIFTGVACVCVCDQLILRWHTIEWVGLVTWSYLHCYGNSHHPNCRCVVMTSQHESDCVIARAAHARILTHRRFWLVDRRGLCALLTRLWWIDGDIWGLSHFPIRRRKVCARWHIGGKTLYESIALSRSLFHTPFALTSVVFGLVGVGTHYLSSLTRTISSGTCCVCWFWIVKWRSQPSEDS